MRWSRGTMLTLAAVAAAAGACTPERQPKVNDTGASVGSVGVEVEVEVAGELVFAGVADAPALGLYQPPIEGADCLASRRVSVIQGSAVFVDLLFPGEFPEPGAQVRFPRRPESPASDWTAATWIDEAGQPWAAYGGIATLDAFDQDLVEMSVTQATLCRSDRVGRIDPRTDGTWSTHTSDCGVVERVVFRTAEPVPFALDQPPWCARGEARSWQTPDGEPLCSENTEPCELEP